MLEYFIMIRNEFLNHNNLLVPLTTDSIVLKKHGINSISLTELLYDNQTLLPCPNILTKQQLIKINNNRYTLAGFSLQYQELLLQLPDHNTIFNNHQLINNQSFIFESDSCQAKEIDNNNGIIACDNPVILKIINKSSIQPLINTQIGLALYYTAQYITYNSDKFLEDLPEKFNNINKIAWNDLKYYLENIGYDLSFKTHINLLTTDEKLKTQLIKQFANYMKTTEKNAHTYIISLKQFLQQQITDTEPEIYPIHTLRFFDKANIVAGLLENDPNNSLTSQALQTCFINKILRTKGCIEQTHHLFNESKEMFKSADCNIKRKIEQHNKCDFLIEIDNFITKAKKANNWDDFHKVDTEPYNSDQISYSKLLKQLFKGEELKNIDILDRLIMLNKYEKLQNELQAFYQKHNFQDKQLNMQFIEKINKKNIKNINLIGKVFAEFDNILLEIGNTMPVLAKIALKAYLYDCKPIIYATPTAIKFLNTEQIKKILNKLFAFANIHVDDNS